MSVGMVSPKVPKLRDYDRMDSVVIGVVTAAELSPTDSAAIG
jgi:hypothetical protein